jgi:UDPglucose 6-dehydrogenase
VHFLGVGTPGLPESGGKEGYDLSQVFGSVGSLAPHLTKDSLIIGKSTVAPGTTEQLAAGISSAEIAWNPEFLREAHAVEDTLRPGRIVVGVPGPAAEATVREVYRPLTDSGIPLVVTDPATAELVKGAANAFLATKISFINAMADICAETGADVKVLADAVGMDPRIGRAFLTAGLGYGGGCLPKDVRGLAAFARDAAADTAATLLSVVNDINVSRRERVANLVKRLAGPLDGKRVALWGAAFKPGTDDVRDAPGLDVANRLYDLGANVVVYDPQATPNALVEFPHLGYADDAAAAADGADAVVVATAWPEFATVEPAAVSASRRLLIDACQAVEASQWRAAGWTVAAPFPVPHGPERAGVAPLS